MRNSHGRTAFGEAAIRAIREVVPAERHAALEGLSADKLGLDLHSHIRAFNAGILRAADIFGVKSDEYGRLVNATSPHRVRGDISAPAGIKSVLRPEGVSAYLVQRLISIGALPVPATPIEDIIVSLTPQQEDAATEQANPMPQGALRELIESTPDMKVVGSHELGMMVSGEGLVNKCVSDVSNYALDHLDELDDLIREIWHASNICFDGFLVNEERGGRAALFAEVRIALSGNNPLKGGDTHAISIAMRSEDFKMKILPLLLCFRNPFVPLPF